MSVNRIFAVILTAIILLLAPVSRMLAGEPESEFPSLELQTIDGENMRIAADPAIRYTVLEFWALWCAPCVESLPKLDEVFQGLKDKPLRFFLVNCDNTRSRAKVRSFVRSNKIGTPVALDPSQSLVRFYNIRSWPHLIILDSEGRIVDRKTEYLPGDEFLLEKELLELLER